MGDGSAIDTSLLLCHTRTVPIPPFNDTGLLPAGVHEATWAEIAARLGGTERRDALLEGLRRALLALQVAGCVRAYLDGSFVTDKSDPGDFDGCWDARNVDPNKLDPILLEFADRRSAQKSKFGGEMFIADSRADPGGTRFLDFFQRDKATGDAKGIVAIDLGGLT